MNRISLTGSVFVFLLTLLIIVPACTKDTSDKNTKIGTESLLKNLILIDVNDDGSFNDAHITGSLHMPYEKIELEKNFLKNSIENWDKNSTVVVYCIDYACTASHIVAKKIKNSGFKHVFVYNGGIQEWYQLAQQDKNIYPYVGPAIARYLKRPISKFENSDSELDSISAQELSKLIAQSA